MSKEVAMQTQGPEFSPQKPYKKTEYGCVCLEQRQRQAGPWISLVCQPSHWGVWDQSGRTQRVIPEVSGVHLHVGWG